MKKHLVIVLILIFAIVIPLEVYSQNSKIYQVIKSKCIGCQLCIKECPVDAITMQNGKAVIDAEKCIGCSLCVKACNFDAIVLKTEDENPAENNKVETQQVADSTKKTEPIRIFKVIEKKCIGCKICVDKCPTNAIEMINRKAVIDMEKCIKCGICEAVCPVNAIKDTMIAQDSFQKAD